MGESLISPSCTGDLRCWLDIVDAWQTCEISADANKNKADVALGSGNAGGCDLPVVSLEEDGYSLGKGSGIGTAKRRSVECAISLIAMG